MTSAPLAAAPVRNWGGVLLTIVAIASIVFTALQDVHTAQFEPFGGPASVALELIAYVIVPTGVVVAMVPLAFGTRRLVGVVGRTLAARLVLVAWSVFAAFAQVANLLVVQDDLADLGRDVILKFATEGAVLVLGIVAAVFVVRAGLARGFARWSLLLAVALYAFSAAAFAFATFGEYSLVSAGDGVDVPFLVYTLGWDLPRLLSFLILGISWWRVGIPRGAVSA